MDPKLKNMLERRGRPSRVVETSVIAKNMTKYRLSDGGLVLVCPESLRKVHTGIVSEQLLGDCANAPRVLVVAPDISRPAEQELVDFARVEYVSSEVFSFDRTVAKGVPMYERLADDDVSRLEKSLQCPRHKWPRMQASDPVAKYLGLVAGDCVSYGVEQDVRVVVACC